MTAPPSFIVKHTSCYSERGCFKTVYWSRFPRTGRSTSLLLLDAEPKQADLPPWSPLSAGRKFSVVRRRSHCVCLLLFPEADNKSMHNALAWNFTMADSQHVYFILSQTETLSWLSGADMTLALNCMITGSHICNCTYEAVAKPDLAGVWGGLFIHCTLALSWDSH